MPYLWVSSSADPADTDGPTEERMVHGYTQRQDEIQARLRKIEGQIRGLQRMIEEDRYCIDVLTQISSATKALQGVATGLLDDHVRHCVRDAIGQGENAADEKVDEALEVIHRLIKR